MSKMSRKNPRRHPGDGRATPTDESIRELRLRLPDTNLFGDDLEPTGKTAPRKRADGRKRPPRRDAHTRARDATEKRRAAAKAAACEGGIGYETRDEAEKMAQWSSAIANRDHECLRCEKCGRYHVRPREG